jgi:CRISPR/Cas system-associated exonuclease Cas4 (RecB family)
MVNEGIEPQDIAVIVPDEKFKNSIALYDKLNNFNFSMGFNYNQTKIYKQLEAIYHYWHSFSDKSISLINYYEIDIEKLNSINPKKRVKIDDFFDSIDFIDLDLNQDKVQKRYFYFKSLFASYYTSIKEWLFLWLKQLNNLTIDDVRGGKITVMGALETRGVSFRGVLIVDFNDGIVPAIPAKDNFLNSSVRKFANLPTKNDREALQKQIYKRVLEEADKAVILYSLSNNKSPASYLYELGLDKGESREPNLNILYSIPSQIVDNYEPIIENFNAKDIVWSATRLKIFLTCKRRYYYIYHQKLKPKQSDDINEGAFLHYVLDKLFQKRDFFNNFDNMKIEIDKLIDKILKTTSAKIAYSKLLWKAKLEKFIRNQIEHFKMGWRVVEREKYIKGDINGLKFKGIVDRIDQDTTHTLIIDYKSGSTYEANRTKNLEKLTDFQMSIYNELLKDTYQNIDLAFIELFSGKIIPITELKSKTELLYQHISHIKNIDKVICYRCEDVSRCQYCDYTLLCERGDFLS